MKQQIILKTVLIATLFSGLTACSQAKNTFLAETEDQGSSAAGLNPGSATTEIPAVVNIPPAVPASCAAFLRQPPVIDYSATIDRDYTGSSGIVVVPEALRTVFVGIASGSIDIRSAITASIDSNSGNVRINAQDIQTAKVGSGELCIRANSIGTADANGSSGSQVLAAVTINKIHLGAGAFHIYRATVNHLEWISGSRTGSKGQICLHDGAKILDLGPYDPNVVDPTCK
jgi:hypothetical protein